MDTDTHTPSPVATGGRSPRTLIASDRVVGAEVRRPDSSKIGRIERLMLDKASGRVAYVVMSFGGFLGLGEDYYTLPWAVLTYDTGMDAYSVDITEEQLRNAPARSPEGGDPQDEREWEEHVHRYYNAAPYWGI